MRGSCRKLGAERRWRARLIWTLLAPLFLLGIANPQIAFAAPSVSLPTTLTAGTSFTNVNSQGALSISGYNVGASIQVTVSATSGNLKIVTTTGLTAPTGYTSAAWTSGTATEIAFYGSQTDVSNALNSMQYKASAVDAPATITVTSFVAGAAYNSTTGHFYEIVENGSVINWELARCKALYSNLDISVSAGASLMNTNRCTSSTTLTRRTLGGLQGYLATITTQAEHEFIYSKLTGTGWIGGADTDSEGTFIWMDGPEKGQVFWTSASTQRGTTTTVSGSVAGFSYGSNRYNYFNTGEPNDAGGVEDFAEFGFGANGSWNDCQNACNRTRYVIEYGENGDALSGASGTINVNPRSPVSTETDTAISLSGSQFLSSAQEAPFDIATGTTFTLEAWVRPSVTNAAQILLGKNNQYSLLIHSNGSFGMNFYTTSVPAGCGGDSGIFGANSVRANEWQHVAVVRNGSTVTGYLNGQAVGTLAGCSATDSIKTGSNLFVVGGYSTTDQPFTGQIDQVRVWSSARTASELQSGMSTFIPTPQTNLIGAYGFNENSGTKIFNNATSSIWETDLNLNGGSSSWPQIAETSTVNAYSLVTFRRNYLTSSGGWRAPRNVQKLQYLVVAGGGAGGTAQVAGEFASGGGGGGGVRQGVTQPSTDEVISIQVGRGQVSTGCIQGRGQNSVISGTSISSISATGGGSGACIPSSSAPYTLTAGQTGGSGGGGGSWADRSASAGSGNLGGYSPVEGFAGGAARVDGGGSAGQAGGGGGGAGGIGGSPVLVSSVWNAGNGGIGVESTITGSSVYYGGGGGGGKRGSIAGGIGGNGGGGNGGDNSSQGTSGTNGLGGGGGGNSKTSGNHGGSGIVIFRWITATAPIYSGPVSDTLTAGMVETFTVTGDPVSPLTRGYRWQVSSDTGTTWVNATTGTGLTSASYTTPILETTTSGTRYRYRVVVTDSDASGLSIVDTSTAIVFLTINPRITITGSSVSLTQKYGQTQTVTYTIANGTGTRTTVASPNNRTGITWSSVSGSSATLGIGAGLGFGTYYETLTVTDSVTATTTQMITISVSKADTITVTMDTITALTYTGSAALVNPSVVITGLSSADTATVQYNYEGSTLTYNATSSGLSCANGGTCVLGDLAPGGGRVFYVSATKINAAEGVSDGGIYLATAPDSWWTSAGISSYSPVFISNVACRSIAFTGSYTDSIGSGAENTRQLMTNSCAQLGGVPKDISTSTFGGYSDWFVPSMAELQVMYTNLYVAGRATVPAPGWTACSYWSSNPATASNQNTLYMACNGLGGTASSAGKGSSSGQSLYAMPIRAFSPLPTSSSVAPTNAGNYTALPVNFTIASPSSLANYQGVTVTGRSFTINKANQAKLSIGQYDAFPGISSYPINVYGGTGLGAVTRSLVSAGTAGCTIDPTFMFLSAANQGICSVRAVKVGGTNYFDETTTATIYWIAFRTNYSNGAAGGATGITLTGETSITKLTYETFTVLSFANGSGTAVTSASVGSTLRIIGTGFNAADSTTEVFFGMTSVPASSLTFNVVDPLANYVQLTVPIDAETDRVVMRSAKGWATSSGTLTITP